MVPPNIDMSALNDELLKSEVEEKTKHIYDFLYKKVLEEGDASLGPVLNGDCDSKILKSFIKTIKEKAFYIRKLLEYNESFISEKKTAEKKILTRNFLMKN